MWSKGESVFSVSAFLFFPDFLWKSFYAWLANRNQCTSRILQLWSGCHPKVQPPARGCACTWKQGGWEVIWQYQLPAGTAVFNIFIWPFPLQFQTKLGSKQIMVLGQRIDRSQFHTWPHSYKSELKILWGHCAEVPVVEGCWVTWQWNGPALLSLGVFWPFSAT